MNIVMPATVLW